MSLVCWVGGGSYYTTTSYFTQTLYLDYRHYVPINTKENCHFKLFGESAYCLSGKKQREKLKYIIIS